MIHHGDIGRIVMVGGAVLAALGWLASNRTAITVAASATAIGLVLYTHDDYCHRSCAKGKPIILCTCPHGD